MSRVNLNPTNSKIINGVAFVTALKVKAMPEMLKEYGAYFDPLDQKSILEAILTLINSPSLRYELAEKSYKESQKYSWMRCANETFSFIHQIEAVTKKGL